jgi:hypothetical protein
MLDTHKIKAEAIGLCDDTKLWYYKCENNNFDNNSNIYTDKASFTELMKIKYNYLYTNSSTLFERCLVGDLNMQQFHFMLEMLDKVNSGADYQTTSTEVGQRLVDVYVKPLIEKDK